MSHVILHTPDGEKITKRLVNHWRHKFEVSQYSDHAIIHMTGADVVLSAQADTLSITLTCHENSEQPVDEARLRTVIANHIDRMANHSFDYAWQD